MCVYVYNCLGDREKRGEEEEGREVGWGICSIYKSLKINKGKKIFNVICQTLIILENNIRGYIYILGNDFLGIRKNQHKEIKHTFKYFKTESLC